MEAWPALAYEKTRRSSDDADNSATANIHIIFVRLLLYPVGQLRHFTAASSRQRILFRRFSQSMLPFMGLHVRSPAVRRERVPRKQSVFTTASEYRRTTADQFLLSVPKMSDRSGAVFANDVNYARFRRQRHHMFALAGHDFTTHAFNFLVCGYIIKHEATDGEREVAGHQHLHASNDYHLW